MPIRTTDALVVFVAGWSSVFNAPDPLHGRSEMLLSYTSILHVVGGHFEALNLMTFL